MYVSLMRLLVEASEQSPIVYVLLIVSLLASWGLIVVGIADIAIKFFDAPAGSPPRIRSQR
ncbi:MAG: hypothetical protein ACOX2L_06850 [Anaerolineae bacterium]|jgi:hypothetical protein|nr:hypothetical protein [Chloroflexota bacterium]